MLGLPVYKRSTSGFYSTGKNSWLLDYEAVRQLSISIPELPLITYLSDLYVVYLLRVVKYVAFPCFLMMKVAEL